ncbi:glycosyltransferase family 2 protein [Weeksella virosa]|uniref:glycosyltransferase family 2 protein n=2 Tax=Weeksella TaxID=1013 RepID=UPI0009F6FAFB|nr:glycosyltransferase family 2 protein [Weeksella virosa]MDK7375931.1 glycosyltransferase family 2 protein [Weeksella virosa]
MFIFVGMKMNTSLVVSTYNWAEALELVLKSIQVQTHLPDEVIIADDGSTKETKRVIYEFRQGFPNPVTHVWHEDLGNRKAIIMNKAIAKTTSDYIISIDGDVILHPNFVEDHLAMAEKNTYLYGSRVNIQKSKLQEIFQHKTIHFHFFSKGIKKRGRTLRYPFLAKKQKKHSSFSSKMRGCNFSFWRKDFIKVNGYNEEITGWGREDSELVLRMHNAGILAKRLKFAGIVYHMYHPEQSKEFLDRNDKIQQKTIEQKLTFASKGVNQYTEC